MCRLREVDLEMGYVSQELQRGALGAIISLCVALGVPVATYAGDSGSSAAGNAQQAASKPEPIDLSTAERQVFSQFGEDGVLEKIFEIIEPTHKYVVEFGAHDGITNSNARSLVLSHGWGGFLIEGSPARAKKLHAAYSDYPAVKTLEAWVYPGNIEILFEDYGVPNDLDLLVIDIDSNDYYIWNVIHQFRPKVVMIEANPHFPPPQLMVVKFHPMNYWDGTIYGGASLQSLYRLAKKKGYELIYCMSPLSPNAFFVDKKYYDRFGIDDNRPVKLWKPRIGARPNPTLISEEKKYLKWNAFQIEKEYILDR